MFKFELYGKTRLISIESQPKKIVVVVVIGVVHVVVVVIPVVDTRNIPFKFGWNQVINRWDVVHVVVVVVSVVVVVIVIVVVIDRKHLHYLNLVSNSWDIADFEFVWWWVVVVV